MSTRGTRLREERERLEYTQESFATIGKVSKRSQIMYEQDKTEASADYFTNIAMVGADVQYILTGKRAVQVLDKQVEAAIKLFAGMDKKQREQALSVITHQERHIQMMAA